jgi:ribonuclease P protein component
MRKEDVSPAGTIRRSGLRVAHGPWAAYVALGAQPAGRLIVALGRSAGGAVTRSRIRRIARDLFRPMRDTSSGIDVLLLARNNVGQEPRRNVRRALQGLFERGGHALTKRNSSRVETGE